MRRFITPLAVAALLVLGLLLALALTGPAVPDDPAEQAQKLAAELRCPDCQSLSVAESRTAAADAIRREIAAQLAAGRSPNEVRQHFVARYGQWILLQPADPLLWLLPAVALLLGIAAFALWLRAGQRQPTVDPRPLSEEDRLRVRDELEALDG